MTHTATQRKGFSFMQWKGFAVEKDGIYIYLDNFALRFDSAEEMEFIAEKIKKSANEIKEGES